MLGDILQVWMEAVGLLLTKEAENGARAILHNGVVIAEGDIRTLRKELREILKRRGDDLLKYLDELVELKKIPDDVPFPSSCPYEPE